MPEVERPFRLGSKGNGLMWFVAGLSILSVIVTILVSLIPPSSISESGHIGYIIYQVAATVIMVVIALLIFKFKKPEWKKQD